MFCCHLTDYNASNHISGAAIDLYIDGLVVGSDGNLLDALAAAIKVSAAILPNSLYRTKVIVI